MRIVLAPNAFKECLSAECVAEAMAAGARRALPADDTAIDTIPLGDGGDGTGAILSRRLGANWIVIETVDPLGRPISSGYFYDAVTGTAIIEIASAIGLTLLEEVEKNPMKTSSAGVAALLRAAVDVGATKIIVCLGGSATNDAGAGMAYDLGFTFVDDDGHTLVPIGGNLHRIRSCRAPQDRITVDRLLSVDIVVAVDTNATLLGDHGATATFAKQKGARPEELPLLEAGLENMLSIWNGSAFLDGCRSLQGSGCGAAGGLGAGLVAFVGGSMRSGFEIVADTVDFDRRVLRADLVITGEGIVDDDPGKVPMSVALRCRRQGVACAAITGRFVEDEGAIAGLIEAGAMAGVFAISPGPMTMAESIERADELIGRITEQVVRLFSAGRK